MKVRFFEPGGLVAFERPHRVLRAHDVASSLLALDVADAALADGWWVAGTVAYELGAAFLKTGTRVPERALVSLGIFEAPVTLDDTREPFTLSPLLPSVGATAYARAIAEIHRRIYDGDVYQVNYTVPFQLHVRGNALALWQAVARTTGANYQAFVEDEDGCILSWSPELFLAFDGTRVTTRPMKGTATLDALDRLDGEKNRAEHVMIVDLLRNDLHRVCDEVTVEALATIERYPRFATMTSTITGQLRPQQSLRDVFTATFPCGSITGAPKRAAYATIGDLEPTARGAYCGTVGYLSPQRRGWWNVAIRTAQIDAEGVGRYDAGGGIVADSDARDEWDELALKTAFLRPFCEPLAIIETFAADAPHATVTAHLARLHHTAQRFRIDYDAASLRARVEEAARAERALVRVRLSPDGRASVELAPLDPLPGVVEICLADARVRSDDAFLRIKTSWRPAADAALKEARARGCFDALLQNERGELTEGGRTNLFVEIDGSLYTPPLHCGLLPGILRSHLVSEGRVIERVLRPKDLASARAIFIGNSARGLLSARLQ